MTFDQMDTRERILTIAQKLFAQKGFNGTSVREIAQEAKVNVAALNYHFQSKQALHREIFSTGFKEMNDKINNLAGQQKLSFADLAEEITKLFLKNHSAIRDFFSLLVSPEGWDDAQAYDFLDIPGPPGFNRMLECLQREINHSIPRELMECAARSILGNIIHFALMAHAPSGKKLGFHKILSPAKCQAHSRLLAELLLLALKQKEKI